MRMEAASNLIFPGDNSFHHGVFGQVLGAAVFAAPHLLGFAFYRDADLADAFNATAGAAHADVFDKRQAFAVFHLLIDPALELQRAVGVHGVGLGLVFV